VTLYPEPQPYTRGSRGVPWPSVHVPALILVSQLALLEIPSEVPEPSKGLNHEGDTLMLTFTKESLPNYIWPWAELAPLLASCGLNDGEGGHESPEHFEASNVFAEANGWTEVGECDFTVADLRERRWTDPELYTEWDEADWAEMFAVSHCYRDMYVQDGRAAAFVIHIGRDSYDEDGVREVWAEAEMRPDYPGLKADRLPLSWFDPINCTAWLLRPVGEEEQSPLSVAEVDENAPLTRAV
jgi:hypothetical protein